MNGVFYTNQQRFFSLLFVSVARLCTAIPDTVFYRGFWSVGVDSPASAVPAAGSDKKSPSRIFGGVAKDDKV